MAGPRTRAMAASPTSRLHVRFLVGAVALVIAALLAPTASATTTSQARASLTNATTGLANASSLAPRNACGVPKPGHAACLAQFLAVRSTGAPVHPHLQHSASLNRV